MTNREISPGYALEDGAALHFSGDEIHQVVVSRPGARAYRVALAGNQVKEEALPAEYLGK
jgi:hypothetical protein